MPIAPAPARAGDFAWSPPPRRRPTPRAAHRSSAAPRRRVRLSRALTVQVSAQALLARRATHSTSHPPRARRVDCRRDEGPQVARLHHRQRSGRLEHQARGTPAYSDSAAEELSIMTPPSARVRGGAPQGAGRLRHASGSRPYWTSRTAADRAVPRRNRPRRSGIDQSAMTPTHRRPWVATRP